MSRLGARLSVQLSAVRRVLRGGVMADRSAVRLDLDHVTSDIEELFSASDDEAVIAAYQGEVLPEDRYEDWVAPLRDEARTRFVTAAHRWAETLAAAADNEGVLWLARRLIEADRYDDTAHRLLISTLLNCGRVGEAERAHGAWAHSLSELGLEVIPFHAIREEHAI